MNYSTRVSHQKYHAPLGDVPDDAKLITGKLEHLAPEELGDGAKDRPAANRPAAKKRRIAATVGMPRTQHVDMSRLASVPLNFSVLLDSQHRLWQRC